jgi:Glycosyltransferase like family 2
LGSGADGGVALVTLLGSPRETTPRVSILTPTIEGRELLLADAAESVRAQTEPVRHLIFLDALGAGPARARNHLLGEVETEWVGFLDDDDLLDPGHVATLMGAIGDAELAWSRCRTVAAPGVEAARVMQTMRPDYDALCRGGRNFIPVTVIARTDAVRDAGCFDPNARYEDYALWCTMWRAGARFVYVPSVTWTYRFLGANRTWTG